MHQTNVNLKAVWLCLKYQIPAMLETGTGAICAERSSKAIVNMASIGGAVIGTSNFSAYEATKAGVIGLTRSAAIEYAGQGIRINAVSPGVIATEILSIFSEDRLQQVSNAVPLKRIGEAAEVANAVIWLCSDAASYITGHNLVIDGGFTVR